MKNDEFKKLESLLRLKSFEDLTVDEKGWIMQNFDHDEQSYDSLHKTIDGLATEKNQAVPSHYRKNLVQLYKKTHQPAWRRLVLYKTPLYANLLVMGFIGIIIWLSRPTKQVIVENIVTRETPARVDTLIVKAPSDTVIIERTITIEKPVYLTRSNDPPVNPPVKGNALSEQKDLQALLVRGE